MFPLLSYRSRKLLLLLLGRPPLLLGPPLSPLGLLLPGPLLVLLGLLLLGLLLLGLLLLWLLLLGLPLLLPGPHFCCCRSRRAGR